MFTRLITLSLLTVSLPGCMRLIDPPPLEGSAGFKCYDDDDCNDGLRCQGLSGARECSSGAALGAACSDERACAQDLVCLADECAKPECTETADAACAPYYCDTSTYACLSRCEYGSDCQGDRYTCEEGACEETRCDESNAAKLCGNFACDSDTQECKTSCDGDSDCGGGARCVSNTCASSCTPGGDECGVYACRNEGVCNVACDGQEECAADSACVAEQCVDARVDPNSSCTVFEDESCGPYACALDLCLASCSEDSHCQIEQGYRCESRSCEVSEEFSPKDGLTAGYSYTCAMKAGQPVQCWGGVATDSWDSVPPPTDALVRLVGGFFHACGLLPSGEFSCWGEQSHVDGVAGLGGGMTQLALGNSVNCGLDSSGVVHCPAPWDGEPDPTIPGADDSFVSIKAGGSTACALRADGTYLCWGDGVEQWRYDVGAADGPYDVIAVGDGDVGADPVCGLDRAGMPHCWADGPSPGEGLGPFVDVVVGAGFACGLTEAGAAECWGANDIGQTDVPFGAPAFVRIAAGREHACGQTSDGSVVCWGGSEFNEAATVPPSFVPG